MMIETEPLSRGQPNTSLSGYDDHSENRCHEETPLASSSRPSLSLNVGNISFELIPKTNDGIIRYQASDALSPTTTTILDLENFTGSLRVVMTGKIPVKSREMPTTTAMTVDEGNDETPKSSHSILPPQISTQKKRINHDKATDDDEEKEIVNKRPRRTSSFALTLEQDKEDDQEEDAQETGFFQSHSQQPILLEQVDLSQTVSHSSHSNSSPVPDMLDYSDEGEVVTDTKHETSKELLFTSGDQGANRKGEENDTEEKQQQDPTQDANDDVNYNNRVGAPARVSLCGGVCASSPSPIKNTKQDFLDSPAIPSPLGNLGTSRFVADVGSAMETYRNRESSGEEIAPCPRWGSTFTRIGDHRWIIYGGQTVAAESGKVKTLNEVYSFETASNDQDTNSGGGKWVRPMGWMSALPRQWHTATFIPDQQSMLVFGGESFGTQVKIKNEVMLLDVDAMVWYPASVSGQVPAGRSGHSATLLHPPPQPSSFSLATSFLVIFGGVGLSTGKWLNSISILDTKRWIWFQPKCQGMAPQPRSYHTATAIGHNRIIVFGGNRESVSFDPVHVLTVATTTTPTTESTTSTTSQKKTTLKKKTATKSSSTSMVPHQYQSYVWSWSHPSTVGPKPAPRTGQFRFGFCEVCYWILFCGSHTGRTRSNN